MLVFEERGKPEYPEKNLSEQSREPTNSVHIWRRVRESNPGHIGGRRALSPLRQPCSPNSSLLPFGEGIVEKSPGGIWDLSDLSRNVHLIGFCHALILTKSGCSSSLLFFSFLISILNKILLYRLTRKNINVTFPWKFRKCIVKEDKRCVYRPSFENPS